MISKWNDIKITWKWVLCMFSTNLVTVKLKIAFYYRCLWDICDVSKEYVVFLKLNRRYSLVKINCCAIKKILSIVVWCLTDTQVLILVVITSKNREQVLIDYLIYSRYILSFYILNPRSSRSSYKSSLAKKLKNFYASNNRSSCFSTHHMKREYKVISLESIVSSKWIFSINVRKHLIPQPAKSA